MKKSRKVSTKSTRLQNKSDSLEWEQKFKDKLGSFHKRNVDAKVKKLLKKITRVKSSMVTRSNKYNVPCEITIEELREMTYQAYGNPCKYFPERILTIENMVFDHIIPISKNGTSNKDNIQIISKTANSIKGSLMESELFILLDWLKTIPDNLAKDIRIRLCHGIH